MPQFEIFDLIGRGGMGAVYKGRQRSLDRTVAIKILPGEFASGDAEYAVRFQREARAMARLSHPSIVAVHDVGETPGGLLYFVMDDVEGTDVQQMLATGGRLPLDEALRITTCVCDALAYAHGKGIIHRDIKPSNVMLGYDRQVKVADFGLAKVASTHSSLLTASDAMMGTPDFMAPESLLGTAQVDHRADLYAIGVMLYQMLTGKLPRGRFEPPSRLVPGLDRRLDAIIDRTLQNERDARYSSALELRSAIEPVLTRSLARSTASTPRSWKKPALLGGAALLLGVGAFIVFRPPAPAWKAPAKLSGGDAANLASATKDAPFVNSLGMKFVPAPITGGPTGGQRGSPQGTGQPLVPGAATSVLFSVWETRVQDFEAFVQETQREWKRSGALPKAPLYPALEVSWHDATAFCQWLTERERKAGRLATSERYRLPTDHEWSCAVGIGDREDPAKSPESKSRKTDADAFPWGRGWPPPAGVVNYRGEEAAGQTVGRDREIITGYRDAFPLSAPVGSFAANALGIFDLGGNAQEWCEDWYRSDQQERVYRGAAFTKGVQEGAQSDARGRENPERYGSGNGFRCVLAAETAGKPSATSQPADSKASTAFPPGQWVDVISKIPASYQIQRLPDGWVKWSDGRTSWVPAGFNARNVGLRGRFKGDFTTDNNTWPQLLLPTRADSVQLFIYEPGGNQMQIRHRTGKEWPKTLAETPLQPRLDRGVPYTLEFFAIGQRLIARCNGQTVTAEWDDSGDPRTGEVRFYALGKDLFRDLEVINLDGLPEAEARKAAGLDAAAAK